MSAKTSSSQQLYAAAKKAVNDAERKYEKVSNSYFRLYRDRVDRDGHRRGEPNEAEKEARRVYDAATQALSAARGRLVRLEMTVPRPKPPRRRMPEGEEDLEEVISAVVVSPTRSTGHSA
jgi:hypothetical protein